MTVYSVLAKVPQGEYDRVQVRTYDNPERELIPVKLCRDVFIGSDLYDEVDGAKIKGWIVYGLSVRSGVLTVLALPPDYPN